MKSNQRVRTPFVRLAEAFGWLADVEPHHVTAFLESADEPEARVGSNRTEASGLHSAPAGPKIFIAHSADDEAVARRLTHHLRSRGFDPWLDRERLMPGIRWREAIREAIEVSDAVVVLISAGVAERRGFIQQEIKYAMEMAERRPAGQIFIVPVLIDDSELPPQLRDLHAVRLHEKAGADSLLAALGRPS
jgi:hypothetical protein